MSILDQIKSRLEFLYPGKKNLYDRLKELLDSYYENPLISEKRNSFDGKLFSEKDSILITYGDSIQRQGEKPLRTLHEFLTNYVKDKITGVHILPFFPYSSDDGFSVIDYKEVNPELGSWEEIRAIGKDYRLMADLVINHISQKSSWFQGFLRGEEKYQYYFLSFDEEMDTSQVFRPRTHPLLTPFETSQGKKYVWTTFSADQIDLNFECPDVLLEMVDVFLFYLSQGIEIIRLDAIGFLWKELGTNCFHLKQTHEVVKLFRDIASYIAPYSVMITETNVPYEDNISYFGEGDEAHMVYQFSFPPLVLDAFLRQDSKYLQNLYCKLSKLPTNSLFFNFLASHDGIGVLSASEVLQKQEFENLLQSVQKHDGLISYKSLPDGGKKPYELNINYFDAINDPHIENEKAVEKFLASQSIIILSKGVPGIYIHSLLGSRNDLEGVKKSGINRRINREKLNYEELKNELADESSRRAKVLRGYLDLLVERSRLKNLNPYLPEKVIETEKPVLILEKNEEDLIVINLSENDVEISEYKNKYEHLREEKFSGTLRSYETVFLSKKRNF